MLRDVFLFAWLSGLCTYLEFYFMGQDQVISATLAAISATIFGLVAVHHCDILELKK